MNKTIKTQKYSIRALFMPDTINEEERTIEVTFATNAPYRRYVWTDRGPELVNEILQFGQKNVRMDRLNASAPLLNNHNRYGGVQDNVLGVVEKAWLDKNEGRAIVRFSKRENAAAIFEDVQDGILRNISVGYQVYKYEREKGQEVDTFRAVDWEPFEISLVDVPADFKAQIRSEENERIDTQVVGEDQEEQVETIPNTYYAELKAKI